MGEVSLETSRKNNLIQDMINSKAVWIDKHKHVQDDKYYSLFEWQIIVTKITPAERKNLPEQITSTIFESSSSIFQDQVNIEFFEPLAEKDQSLQSYSYTTEEVLFFFFYVPGTNDAFRRQYCMNFAMHVDSYMHTSLKRQLIKKPYVN